MVGSARQLLSWTGDKRRRRVLPTAAITVLLAAGGAADRGLASSSTVGATHTPLGSWRRWGATEIRSLDAMRDAAERRPSARMFTARGALPASNQPKPLADELLSNETTFTRSAFVAAATPIYQRPTAASPIVARLHWYTEDGFSENYLLLRAHRNAQGQEWVLVRIPKRPNGTVGWVRRESVGAFHLTHEQLVVDRSRLRIRLYRDGRLLWSAPVAVGKPSTPTPAGHFWIRERFTIKDPRSGYWPYAFGTSDYSTLTDWPGGGVVGIHGPYYQPWAIPGRVSHGCIRLRAADDAWLAHHISLGTPLRVL